MKYIRQIPKTDEELSKKLLQAGWKRLKEPQSLARLIFYSFPLMLGLGGITLLWCYVLNPLLFTFLHSDSVKFSITLNLDTVSFILLFFVVLSLHECLHALFIPNILKSKQVFWGFNAVVAFVYTTQPIKKERFLLIASTPFLLISLVLPVILQCFQLLNWYTVFLCLFNAMGSSVDYLNIGIVLFQVKKGQWILNNGFETYYKNAKQSMEKDKKGRNV